MGKANWGLKPWKGGVAMIDANVSFNAVIICNRIYTG
jgi:hypothetical protein